MCVCAHAHRGQRSTVMSSLGIFPPYFLRWSFSLGVAAAKTLLTTPQSISMTGVCHHTPQLMWLLRIVLPSPHTYVATVLPMSPALAQHLPVYRKAGRRHLPNTQPPHTGHRQCPCSYSPEKENSAPSVEHWGSQSLKHLSTSNSPSRKSDLSPTQKREEAPSTPLLRAGCPAGLAQIQWA